MVGLPARGKTYTARKLARYLSWRGYTTKVFNVGNLRREMVGADVPHQFFDPANEIGVTKRREIALAVLKEMIAWMRVGGQVAIYDATNSTESRRKRILKRCSKSGLQVLFVETICNNHTIIESNIKKTKLSSPDYAGIDSRTAAADFRARIAHYQRRYESIGSDTLSYIKITDVGQQVVANRLQGYLMGQIVNFLMNLHITPRKIYLTRHGQSLANVANIIGSNADLSEAGGQYATTLSSKMNEEENQELVIWTSTYQRGISTAKAMKRPFVQLKVLDEIEAGAMDGYTYAEIASQWPDEAAARAKDKLRYRYPKGESYEDVILRITPLIIELERQTSPVLIISHQAVLRTLYAYLTDKKRDQVPYLDIPLHTLIELTPHAYGCEEKKTLLSPL